MKNVYLIDDQSIANFITRKLLELEGFNGKIKEFTDARIALQELIKEEDTLIFLDLNMPGMNGWEFLEEIKARDLHPEIIVLTSSTSKCDLEKSKQYPFVIKYMVKPLTKEKFRDISGLLKISQN